MIGVTNDLEYAVLLVFFMHKLDGKMRLQLIDVKKEELIVGGCLEMKSSCFCFSVSPFPSLSVLLIFSSVSHFYFKLLFCVVFRFTFSDLSRPFLYFLIRSYARRSLDCSYRPTSHRCVLAAVDQRIPFSIGFACFYIFLGNWLCTNIASIISIYLISIDSELVWDYVRFACILGVCVSIMLSVYSTCVS